MMVLTDCVALVVLSAEVCGGFGSGGIDGTNRVGGGSMNGNSCGGMDGVNRVGGGGMGSGGGGMERIELMAEWIERIELVAEWI